MQVKSGSTYFDPMRLYDRPIWLDVWFIVGIILTVPNFLVATLVLVRAEFSWDLADRSISGFGFLVGQTVVLFAIGSLVPVFIRRSIRRGKLSVAPMRPDPGFYADPIRKSSQRYWNGTDWTSELRQPYKREAARMLFLCGVFFGISLLLGMGSAMKGLAGERLKQAYDDSVSLTDQLGRQAALGASDSGRSTDPEALIRLTSSLAIVGAAMDKAVADYPRRDGEATALDGVPLVKYEAFSKGFAALGDQLQELSGQLQQCGARDGSCVARAIAAHEQDLRSIAGGVARTRVEISGLDPAS
ncbi:MAG: DUF2510 domain-containing protein [Candidatus Nanopelagicales bacterium]